MNKIEKTFSAIDRKIDQGMQKVSFFKNFFRRNFAFITTLILCTFVLLVVVRVFYTRPRLIATIIEDDIRLISLALEKIDSKCSILSFDDEKNEVDFLNVKSFTGSRVGPINLAYPAKWEGPYLQVNPTIQAQHYEVVKAADGLFILPGAGVTLPNGNVMGKEVVVMRDTEIAPMLKKDGALRYLDKKLGAKIKFGIGDINTWRLKEETVKSLDKMLQEFHEAIPFTQNEAS